MLSAAVLASSALLVASVTGAYAQSAATARPGYQLAGTIRIIGSAQSSDAITRLDALFEAKHPGLHMHFEPANNLGAIDSLVFDATLVAPLSSPYGGGIAYSDIVKAPPFFIRIAHGSLDGKAQLNPLVVIVHPANPIAALTIEQLASIFSKPLRAPVLSAWTQLGAKTAALGSVEPAGLPWSDHYASEDVSFSEEVFLRKFNNAPPVDTYAMFATYAEVVQYVATHPSAIGLVSSSSVTSGVRVVALADSVSGKQRMPTADDIRAGRYPLDRCLYLYARQQHGKPLDALALEYLQLALSLEGQKAIADAPGNYLPLNSTEIAEELSKLQ